MPWSGTSPRTTASPAAAQTSSDLLDRIVTALHQVGVGLQAAVELPRDTATQRIEEALGTLNDLIGEIRDVALADLDQ